jgi:hypothetical protein
MKKITVTFRKETEEKMRKYVLVLMQHHTPYRPRAMLGCEKQ